MHGKPVEVRRCPRNGKRERESHEATAAAEATGRRGSGKAREPGDRSVRQGGALALRSKTCGLRGRLPREARILPTMKALSLASLAGLASLAAHAQLAAPTLFAPSIDPMVVTAKRGLEAGTTMRDAIVITRDEIEAAGPVSLGELLQRKAGIELRATGGPGQPESIFIRGAGSAQTLVLIDGLRAGSATVGTTAIEAIPLEMIERVEVVKGPLSSLYGSDAIGGVIQVFTRRKDVPHLFAETAYGTRNDRRVSAGLSTADDTNRVSLSGGYRAVDARSATNPRSFSYNPDDDPFESSFFTLDVSHRMWTGEWLAIEAFGTNAGTHFDSGQPGDDKSRHRVAGAKFTSSTHFAPDVASYLTIGEGLDKLDIAGNFPSRFETKQLQATWMNELAMRAGKLVLGIEGRREQLDFDPTATPFAKDRRDTSSAFMGADETWMGQRLEGSVRYDHEEQYGGRTTGSASYGLDWPSIARFSFTYARGFRAPTFYDLYGPSDDFYRPNPALQPETSKSYEIALRSDPAAELQWKLAAFDNRYENLITYSFEQLTVLNVAQARARGIEATLEARWWGAQWRGTVTWQRPKDEDTGFLLQGRAERYGSAEASKRFGDWTVGACVQASGPRFDSTNEAPGSKLGGYGVVDARVAYAITKQWTAQLAATNLFDKHYEGAVGYDAPRRGVVLSVRFESF